MSTGEGRYIKNSWFDISILKYGRRIGGGVNTGKSEMMDPSAVRRLAAMYTTNINDMPYERLCSLEHCTY